MFPNGTKWSAFESSVGLPLFLLSCILCALQVCLTSVKYMLWSVLAGKVRSLRDTHSYEDLVLCWSRSVLEEELMRMGREIRPWDDGALAPRIVIAQIIWAQTWRQHWSLLQWADSETWQNDGTNCWSPATELPSCAPSCLLVLIIFTGSFTVLPFSSKAS